MNKYLAVLILLLAIIFWLLPFVIAGIIIVVVLLTCSLLFKRAPQKISRFIYTILTPLLIVGWVYYGYIFITQEYYNTYSVSYIGINEYKLHADLNKDYTITATSDEDVYIKVWKKFIADNKDIINSSDDWYHYHRSISIRNKTKNKKVYPYFGYYSLVEAEKLYYRKGNQEITFIDILR